MFLFQYVSYVKNSGNLQIFITLTLKKVQPFGLCQFKVIYKLTTKDAIVAHCVKHVRIRSYSGPHFPAFGLNTDRYGVSLRVQSECGKMRTRITPNTDIFHSVARTSSSSTEKQNQIPSQLLSEHHLFLDYLGYSVFYSSLLVENKVKL